MPVQSALVISNTLQTEFSDLSYNAGERAAREYSFVNTNQVYDQFIIDRQAERKKEALAHKDKVISKSKVQKYVDVALRRGVFRRIYAVKGNPNKNNLLRLDGNNKVLNQKNVVQVPNIGSSLPTSDIAYNYSMPSSRKINDTIIKLQDRLDWEIVDKSKILVPLVPNNPKYAEPVNTNILGGRLLLDVYYDPTIPNEEQVVRTYKVKEQLIVTSQMAEMFAIDILNTYTEEQIEEEFGKTFRQVYTEQSNWRRSNIDQAYHYDVPYPTQSGPHLSSIYITGYSDDDTFLVFRGYAGSAQNVVGYQRAINDVATGTLHGLGMVKDYWAPPRDKPVITLIGSSSVSVFRGTTYSDQGATAVDIDGQDITSSIVTVNPVDITTSNTYTVTYNVTNQGIAANQVTRTVIVNTDNVKPSIVLTGSSTVTVTKDSTYTDAGATASDNVDGNLTSSIVTVNPVNTSNVGTYTVTYNVSDQQGNAANQVTRTVIVSLAPDTTKPIITLIGSSSVTVSHGTTYTDAGATASDIRDGNITSSITTVNPVNTSNVGTYTVTYNVSDQAGNAADQVTRTVTVTDNTKPTITLIGSPSVSITQGSTYTDGGATASDAVDGNITNKIVTVNPVNTANTGTYTITYDISDQAGNVADQVTRSVTVAAARTDYYVTAGPGSGIPFTFYSDSAGTTTVSLENLLQTGKLYRFYIYNNQTSLPLWLDPLQSGATATPSTTGLSHTNGITGSQYIDLNLNNVIIGDHIDIRNTTTFAGKLIPVTHATTPSYTVTGFPHYNSNRTIAELYNNGNGYNWAGVTGVTLTRLPSYVTVTISGSSALNVELAGDVSWSITANQYNNRSSQPSTIVDSYVYYYRNPTTSARTYSYIFITIDNS